MHSVPTEDLMPDSVINSQKGSLVYLAKGQTAYGRRHLVLPLTTVASIYYKKKKEGRGGAAFLSEHLAIKQNIIIKV